MACLDNLISIKSCCSPIVGTSPWAIEDIGITPSEADYYINNDYASGQELIVDKIQFATNLVKGTVANEVSSKLTTKSLVDSQLLGQYQDNLNLKSGEAGILGGISITLNNNNETYYNLFVNSISLQVDTTGDIDVLVYDLISGQLLDTVTVSTVANVISKTILNKTYSSPKRKLDLVFVYDTDGINSNTTYLSNVGCTSCSGYRYWNNYLTATPITVPSASTKIRSSLTNISHTSGLSINYSIQCALDNWLCDMANLMSLPILYKAGVEIMDYAILMSNRQNSAVNIDAERNRERRDSYNNQYQEALNASLLKMVTPKYNECFSCNSTVKLSITLP